jgi:inner membrane transporter RhtA
VGVRTGAGATAGWAPVALPAGLVLAGAVSVQSGAGIATRMFGQLPPASFTTLRLWFAALILLLVAGRGAAGTAAGLVRRRAWADAATALSFGIALGFMNFAIYQALARIPLGIAVTIEFLGPLSVSVAGTLGGRHQAGRASRMTRLAGLGYAALAAAGVALLAGTIGTAPLNWAGVAWAAGAGAAWAAYILGSKAAGQRLPGASGLVLAMCVAAVAVTAPGVAAGAPRMFRPSFLAVGAAIGLLSSVIPYWLELEALRRIPTSLFGVWMSVQPAVAALMGLAILGQRLSATECAGIACVVAASAGASRLNQLPSPGNTGPVNADPAAGRPQANGALRCCACFPALSAPSGRRRCACFPASSVPSGSRRRGRCAGGRWPP